ncbi:MAG: YlxM family DNA-binding protein [Clostridia bacterium]|nr:YlxM family DNA-binding protein [Clostridia bacterium]
MNDILEKTLLLDFYGTLLTDKQREMYELKINDDLSLAEIAEEYNITRQGVSDTIKTCEKTLLDYESKLNLVARYKSLSNIIDKLDNALESKESNEELLKEVRKELENIRKWNNGI